MPTHRGRPTLQRYVGATIFVDRYSNLTYVHLMTMMDASFTVEAKLAFERMAQSQSVKTKHYHYDNGLFDTKYFKVFVIKVSQTISFCEVNAYHQNGKAENRIKNLTTNAHTSLIHAAHRWPAVIDTSLWPVALKNYCNLRNNLPTEFIVGEKQHRKKLPDKYISSPFSKFTGIDSSTNLSYFHPFGSTVYVLKNSLQSLKSHNKWADRSRVGIFLYHSPSHSTSVSLTLNTGTGNVSPQFHCLYDDSFNTCKRDYNFKSLQQSKAKLIVPQQNLTPSTPTAVLNSASIQHSLPLPDNLEYFPPQFIKLWDEPTQLEDNEVGIENIGPEEPILTTTDDATTRDSVDGESDVLPNSPLTPISHEATFPIPPLTTCCSRTGRVIKAASRFDDSPRSSLIACTRTLSPNYDNNLHHVLQPDLAAQTEPHSLALSGEHLFGLLSANPDTMHLREALQQADRDEFIKTMKKELQDPITRKHWMIIPLKNVHKHKKVIPMVWFMKKKRNLLGEIIK